MISQYHAVIFRIWLDEPIYHGLLIGEFKTICGRKTGLYTPLFPTKHVDKFARPCRSCYPGGRA